MLECLWVARAMGGRLALAVMSKSNPTLLNVPYYYGTCKFFLKVFQGRQGNGWQGNLMAEKSRQENGDGLIGNRRFRNGHQEGRC